MLLFLWYRLVGALLRVLLRCGVDERDLETAVLRHQLKILRRGRTRLRFTAADRAFLAAAAGLLSRHRWRSFLVRPDTLVRWHRELSRRRRGHRSRRPARPPLDPSIKHLILRLGRENPRWGYLRIRGELLQLGVDVSATTIATVLREGGLGPAPRRIGPTWAQFLRLQAYGLLSPGAPSEEVDSVEDFTSGPRRPSGPMSEDAGTTGNNEAIHNDHPAPRGRPIATVEARRHASLTLAPPRPGTRAQDGPAMAA